MSKKLKNIPPRLSPIAQAIQAGDSWRADKVTANARGYNYQWQRARLDWLRSHPLCVMCKARAQVTAASVVDHVIPHRGDMVKFWDRTNWQSLCAPCHTIHKARIEARI